MTAPLTEMATGVVQHALKHGWRGALVLESWIEAFASRPLLVLSVFTTAYLPATMWLAAQKLFWEDEFFTLFISAGKWATILDALRTGGDQHPPSFYFLTHQLLSLLGTTHVTVRAASILGFWVMSVCLYAIGRRFLSPAWSVVLLLLPCATGHSYDYAIEARGYSLMCGFAAVAVLCWLMATSGEMRRVTIPALFISAAGTSACHYYGIFIVAPLAVGQAVQYVRSRKLDVIVWTALSGAILPPLLFLNVIRSAAGYSQNFWGKPSWVATLDVYPRDAFIFFALLVGSAFAFSRFRSSAPPRPVALPFAAMMISLTLLPFAILLVAKLITHAFAPRYALVSSIGIFGTICFALARLTSERIVAAGALVILEVLSFGAYLPTRNRWFSAELAQARTMYRLLSRDAGDGAIAIPEVTMFYRVSFYGPISFARRISYPADPEGELRYARFDTIDRGMLALRPWFPINTQPYGKYLREHDRFLVYGHESQWAWLLYDLPRVGTLKRHQGTIPIFDYTRDRAVQTDASRSPTDEQGTMLDKLPNEVGSVCRAFMSPSSCLDLR